MKIRFNTKIWKRIFLGVALLIIVSAMVIFYKKNIAATKIAFINYPSFQLERFQKANDSKWISIRELTQDQIVSDIRKYDVVYIFGRGLHLTKEQSTAIQQAGFAGKAIFSEMANPDADLTNLEGDNLDYITGYTSNGGSVNYTNLLHYSRSRLDHKKWFLPRYVHPIAINKNVFFHIDESKTFTDVHLYENYLRQIGQFRDAAPKIALLTSVPGPFNANRDHLDSIIVEIQRRGWNIYPIAGTTKRFELLQQVHPDLVISMPHGRIGIGNADSVVAYLQKNNIPLLSPLTILGHFDDWKRSPQGLQGGLLTMTVQLPEVDGAANPYVIAAEYKDPNGYDVFKVIPKRLDNFCDMVGHWLSLRKKANQDKHIAIYYFKGPGLNSLEAANMEVVPGLFNLLQNLQKSGYNVGTIPSSADELEKRIQQSGLVLRPYAEGTMSRFLGNGNPALIPSETYTHWAEKDLPPTLWKEVLDKYGAAPGNYMSIARNNQSYIAVARIQFGNVVLLPQPLPGLGDNTFALVHGAKTAPPHPYIASYLWAREQFMADAILHFGTHGSLEFTPGKQVALDEDSWSEALIGTIPHFYYYTIADVGEGIIAKRRSYATLISHLTPPFMPGTISGKMRMLEEQLHKWTTMEDGMLRSEYAKNISLTAASLGLFHSLGVEKGKILNATQLNKLSNIVEETNDEKVGDGLYTPGNPYTSVQLRQTVTQMCIDPVTYGIAKLAVIRGVEKPTIWDNRKLLDTRYRATANGLIDRSWSTRGAIDLHGIVTPEEMLITDQQNAERSKRGSTDAIVSGFIALAESASSGKKARHQHSTNREPANTDQVKKLLVKILPYPNKKAFLLDLKSEKRFRQALSLLDPETRAKAEKIAVAIPKMKAGIAIAQDPEVQALLILMQKPTNRNMVFRLMQDPSLVQAVEKEQQVAHENIRKRVASPEMHFAVSTMSNHNKISTLNYDALMRLKGQLDFLQENMAVLKGYVNPTLLSSSINTVQERLQVFKRKRKMIADAVNELSNALDNVHNYATYLQNSPQLEMQAILNGFNGGYTAPSVGGDPIASSGAIPTGRNLFSIDAEKSPTIQAGVVGNQLGRQLLEQYKASHAGKYPQKVALNMWSGDFIQTEGSMIAEAFYLLGVEPIRDMMGKVVDVQLIPTQALGRPRVDVVVQTSGQFRDLAASRIALIDKAVALAATDKDEVRYPNYVLDGTRQMETELKSAGLSPQEARELSTLRVFGGINGNYGTGIMGMVESGDQYTSSDQVADTYIQNMGSLYDNDKHWDFYKNGIFKAALKNTDAVVQPRQSNTWGPLSLDHVYEFAGGISNAARRVNGKEPEVFLSDTRNPAMAKIQSLNEAIDIESGSTIFNPNYITHMENGGSNAAETFAETFRNSFSWSVLKKDAITQDYWNQMFDVYVKDTLHLQLHAFFQNKNPFALEEMTGVMMEGYRKKLWKATDAQLQQIAALHSQLTTQYGAGCSEFVCGNSALQKEMATHLPAVGRLAYQQSIEKALQGGAGKSSVLLKEDGKEKLGQATDNAPKNANNQETVSAEKKYTASYLIVLLVVACLVIVIVRLRKNKQNETK